MNANQPTTVTVSIGRNYGQASSLAGQPMDAGRWSRFIARTEAIVLAACSSFNDIHFTGEGRGWYQGQAEASFTIIATIQADLLPELQARLSILARIFGQDSIAVTAGQTTIVEAR